MYEGNRVNYMLQTWKREKRNVICKTLRVRWNIYSILMHKGNVDKQPLRHFCGGSVGRCDSFQNFLTHI